MLWDELSTIQIQGVDKQIPVVLPIAATEQHGPHLPVATDRMIAEHLTCAIHEALPDDVLILPCIPVGCSEHHMDFAGSLTVSHKVFFDMVSEVLGSAATHGFRNLIVFNAHGGNIAIGQTVMEAFGKRHPECQVIMLTWWRVAREALLEITETEKGGVGHAGEFETSLMLRIAPHLVAQDKMQPGGNQPTYEWAEADMLRGGKASLYRSMKTMTSNGTYGDPTAASVEKADKITTAVVAEMKSIILSLK